MTIDDKTAQVIRDSLLVIAESLGQIAVELVKIPDRNSLLLTLLAAAHVRAGGSVIDRRLLHSCMNVIDEVTSITHCDVGALARDH